MKKRLDDQMLDTMRNNPDFYIWGVFYFNKQDPRLVVSKQISKLGYTLNFAHPVAIFLVVFIITYLLLSVVL